MRNDKTKVVIEELHGIRYIKIVSGSNTGKYLDNSGQPVEFEKANSFPLNPPTDGNLLDWAEAFGIYKRQ